MFVSNQPQGPARLQNTEKAGTLQAHYIKVVNSVAFRNTKLKGYKNIKKIQLNATLSPQVLFQNRFGGLD